MKQLIKMSEVSKLRVTWITLFSAILTGVVGLVAFRDVVAASPATVKAIQVQVDQNTSRLSAVEKATAANAETLARIDERTKMMAERQGISK